MTNDKNNPIPHFVIRYQQAYSDELEFFYNNLVGKSKEEIKSFTGRYSSLVDGYKAMVWAFLAEAAQKQKIIIKLEKDDIFNLERLRKFID